MGYTSTFVHATPGVLVNWRALKKATHQEFENVPVKEYLDESFPGKPESEQKLTLAALGEDLICEARILPYIYTDRQKQDAWFDIMANCAFEDPTTAERADHRIQILFDFEMSLRPFFFENDKGKIGMFEGLEGRSELYNMPKRDRISDEEEEDDKEDEKRQEEREPDTDSEDEDDEETEIDVKKVIGLVTLPSDERKAYFTEYIMKARGGMTCTKVKSQREMLQDLFGCVRN